MALRGESGLCAGGMERAHTPELRNGSGLAKEQYRAVGSRSTSPGGKRLAADMRRIASVFRRQQGPEENGSTTGSVMDRSHWASSTPEHVSSGLGFSGLCHESTLEASSSAAGFATHHALVSAAAPSGSSNAHQLAVARLQRQCDAERRGTDRRLRQLEQRMDALQGQRSREGENHWGMKLAEVNGSLKGLTEQVRSVEGHVDELEKTLGPRMSALELARHRSHDADQQVHSLDLRMRQCETSQKEVEQRFLDLEHVLGESVQRLSQLEEISERLLPSSGAEMAIQGDHQLEDMQHLYQRLESLEDRAEERQQDPGTVQAQAGNDMSEVQGLEALVLDLAKKVSHLAQKADRSEAAEASLHHQVVGVLNRLATMEEVGLLHPPATGCADRGTSQAWEWTDPHDRQAATALHTDAAIDISNLRAQVEELTRYIEDRVPEQEEKLNLYNEYLSSLARDYDQELQQVASERASEVRQMKDWAEERVSTTQQVQSLRNHVAQAQQRLEELTRQLQGCCAQTIETVSVSVDKVLEEVVELKREQEGVADMQGHVQILREQVLALETRTEELQLGLPSLQLYDSDPNGARAVEMVTASFDKVIEELHELKQQQEGVADMQRGVLDLREQVQALQARADKFVPSSSQLQEAVAAISSEFKLGSNIIGSLQDKSPLEIDVALESLQVACLNAADDIALAVRAEMQELQDALHPDKEDKEEEESPQSSPSGESNASGDSSV